MRLRRLALGLATVLGWRKMGYFIPYRHAAALPSGGRVGAYPAIEALLAARTGAFADLIALTARYACDLAGFAGAPAPAPRWEQDWFPGLDGAVAYTLVRALKPRRLVEVGCGHSSRFFARAARDEGLALAQIAIDPWPRAALAGLDLAVIRATLQDAGAAEFARLGPGDITSLDGSHILMPGTDADLFLNRVLPVLPAGALVHIHDIFLPDDYPQAWTWRGYNEQQGVAALLQGGGWRVLWASHYVRTRCADLLAGGPLARLPLAPGAHESSLWLEKISGSDHP